MKTFRNMGKSLFLGHIVPLWQKLNKEKPSSKNEFLGLNNFQIWCKKSEKSNESFISVYISMVVNGQTCTLDRPNLLTKV